REDCHAIAPHTRAHGKVIMGNTERSDRQDSQTIEQVIRLALRGIRFGSIEIIVHDSKVVQIERKEKTRFDGEGSMSTR
ncbi:MAG TPA: DUF2292 domain-containing protein, partial [Nitrospiraceae bacterium]|nr:DUF2292 domain-containing protein [Nitrospiraceae bacterium]